MACLPPFCAHGRRRYERAYNLRYPYDRGLQLYGKTYTEYSTGYVWRISCKLYQKWNINDPSPILALLLSTTLAPVAGKFGVVAGLIAGYLHSSVALQVGIVYGGVNLYNNGFAGGIVAIFLVPVIQSICDRRARARGGLSL